MTANTLRGRPRGLSLALFLGIFVTSILVSGSGAKAAEGCSPVRAETFSLEIDATRDVVPLGASAGLAVNVYRSVADQNVGPAEHVEVIAVVTVGGVSVGAAGETDHDGQAVLDVRLPRRARPGLADVSAIATSHPIECVEEFGQAEVKGLFRAVR